MTASPRPSVAAVVVTWNSRDYISACLSSLAESATPVEVTVVDNDSSDGTADFIADAFPDVHVIRSSSNLGFAAGINLAVRDLAARPHPPEHLLLLNPDATLDPDALGYLLDTLEVDPQAAIVCPLILREDHTTIWFAGGAIDRSLGDSPHEHQGEPAEIVAGVFRTGRACGCAMLMRLAEYQGFGGMRDELFLYWEDTEFSLRVTDAGRTVLIDTRAHCYHAASASSGGGTSFTYEYYMTRNRLYVMTTHLGHSRARALMTRVPRSIKRALDLALSGQWRAAGRYSSAHLRAYRDFVAGKSGIYQRALPAPAPTFH